MARPNGWEDFKKDEPVDFSKHYASMYTGSMVGAGAVVFALMGYVIANQIPHKDRMVVELNPGYLQRVLGEEEKDWIRGIEYLSTPDKKSRSKEEGGRRLVHIDAFWYWVVNGRKYREMGMAERRREQNRVAQANKRQREKRPQPLPGEAAFEKALDDDDEAHADRITDNSL
jgi:hypothetical protein